MYYNCIYAIMHVMVQDRYVGIFVEYYTYSFCLHGSIDVDEYHGIIINMRDIWISFASKLISVTFSNVFLNGDIHFYVNVYQSSIVGPYEKIHNCLFCVIIHLILKNFVKLIYLKLL